MKIYRNFDRAQLDAAYNNTAAVSDAARILADWDVRSAAVAAAHPRHLDLRYGPRERNRIDYFAATRADAPVLVFIHGGYWQMRAKETFRFLAKGPLAHGISVASVAYTLAPQASLREIAAEIDAALTWLTQNVGRLGGDPQRMTVSGWSAGGHLAALALEHPAVRGGLAISGIFDLEPIRLSFLNDKLGLSADDAAALSPLLNLRTSPSPLFVVYGNAELPELQRQSVEYALSRANAGLPGKRVALDRHNHFTVLEALANPMGEIAALVRELVAP
jgi:acetyl esterase/lipase